MVKTLYDLLEEVGFSGTARDALIPLEIRVKEEPDNPKLRYALASVYNERGDIDGSIKEYLAALKLNPNWTEVQHSLGWAYTMQMRTPDFDKGVYYFREAIRTEPENPGHWYALGCVLQDMGQMTEALAAFRECIAKNPESPNIKDYAERCIKRLG